MISNFRVLILQRGLLVRENGLKTLERQTTPREGSTLFHFVAKSTQQHNFWTSLSKH